MAGYPLQGWVVKNANGEMMSLAGPPGAPFHVANGLSEVIVFGSPEQARRDIGMLGPAGLEVHQITGITTTPAAQE